MDSSKLTIVRNLLKEGEYTLIDNAVTPGIISFINQKYILRYMGMNETEENYYITNDIALTEGDEIFFLYVGNVQNNNLYAISSHIDTNYYGLVLAKDGVSSEMLSPQERIVSYRATEDMNVVLCRYYNGSPVANEVIAFKMKNTPISLKSRINNNKDVIFDSKLCDMRQLFLNKQNKTFVISYDHDISEYDIPKDSPDKGVIVGEGCTIHFAGGSLREGEITFNGTKLTGDINLKGSVFKGTIKNDVFDASWVCHMDGVTDDSAILNSIVKLCNGIHFPAGIYILENQIVVDKSNLTLTGIGNSVLKRKWTYNINNNTDDAHGILKITSDASQGIENIQISNLTFEAENHVTEQAYPGYNKKCEHIHAIEMYGVSNAMIDKCKITSFIGDGIYVGLRSSSVHNHNIIITGNVIDGGGNPCRNGISIVDGENIIVRDNIFLKSAS